MMLVREATPPEIDVVLSRTHALWGGEASLDAYRSRTRALLESPFGRRHYRFMVGVGPDGEVWTACKRYRLSMRMGDRGMPTVGFGAVFTMPDHRRRGLAEGLLRSVMAEEARLGARLALLFTDIGPAYYERLGFLEVACERAEAEAIAGEAPFEKLGSRSAEGLLAWAMPADPRLSFLASPEYWQYKLQRNRPELLIYAPGGVASGFVAVHASAQGLFVEEAGHAGSVAPGEFWMAVRGLAGQRGLPAVAGWLPRVAAEAGFSFSALPTARPMVAALEGDEVPGRVQFWANDHF